MKTSRTTRMRFERAEPIILLLFLAMLGFVLTSPSWAGSNAEPVFEVRKIEHDGIERVYTIFVPESFEPGGAAIVVLHGGGQSMNKVLRPRSPQRRWLSIAREHGAVVLVPNGYNQRESDALGDSQTWNDLRGQSKREISLQDDAGFIRTMIKTEIERTGFDARRVGITGSSNGGMMTYRMLIENPGAFAAGAAFIANMPEGQVEPPEPGTPVMIMNGVEDPLMPWDGGGVGFGGAPVRSTAESVAFWRGANDATEAGDPVTLPDRDPSEGSRLVARAYFTQGVEQPVVLLYTMTHAGHAVPVLPSDPQRPLPPFLGTQNRDARGVDLAWRFMAPHMGIDPEG